MSTAKDSRELIEQKALTLPDGKEVALRMTNLHLFSCGVFSNVYKGTLLNPPTGAQKEIAIKKTWPGENSEKNFEYMFLSGVNRQKHKNIVQMLYSFRNRAGKEKRLCESFVFEFMSDTLNSVIKGGALDIFDIKLYTWQLFSGLRYLSLYHIVHRDIKPVNLLVDPVTGLLKIGDFGSAKVIKGHVNSTAYQVTRFYRPPELLLGATVYNCMVDVWSGGCVLGEMLRGSVLFPGRETRHELKLIFAALGSPSEAECRAMRAQTKIDGEKIYGTGLDKLMPDAPADAVELTRRILMFRPKERLCGRDLLSDAFFDQIAQPGARRTSNGRPISHVVSPQDVYELRKRSLSKAKTSKSNTMTSEETSRDDRRKLPSSNDKPEGRDY